MKDIADVRVCLQECEFDLSKFTKEGKKNMLELCKHIYTQDCKYMTHEKAKGSLKTFIWGYTGGVWSNIVLVEEDIKKRLEVEKCKR